VFYNYKYVGFIDVKSLADLNGEFDFTEFKLVDIFIKWPDLFGGKETNEEVMFFYNNDEFMAELYSIQFNCFTKSNYEFDYICLTNFEDEFIYLDGDSNSFTIFNSSENTLQSLRNSDPDFLLHSIVYEDMQINIK